MTQDSRDPAAGPLDALAVAGLGHDPGLRHALALLAALGAHGADRVGTADVLFDAEGGADRRSKTARPHVVVPVRACHPDTDWAASGAMALTGRPGGPPLRAPGAPASAVRGALLAYGSLLHMDGDHAALDALPGTGILSERARLMGNSRRGPVSAGGSFRLLPGPDGTFGISLARPSDMELVPALTEDGGEGADPWEIVARWAARTPVAEADARAALLGLPAAAVGAAARNPRQAAQEAESVRQARAARQLPPGTVTCPAGPFRLERLGEPAPRPSRPLVVNLSSLWAGPLCTHLLQQAGMRVITVESTGRPDGARRGSAAFHDLLHAGQESVALDLTSAAGARTLRALLLRADVVIEGSRPRALAGLGIDPYALAGERPGLSWVSITAYGRTGPWANRPGFGDDVAAGAELVAYDEAGPVPCGDALADPLTGVHAAVAALASVRSGGGWLADVAMSEVCLAALRLGADGLPRPGRLTVGSAAVRHAVGRAPALGRDTERVLAELLPRGRAH